MMQLIDIKLIKPRDRNPRSISREHFERLCESITLDPEFLEMRPILVYETDNGYIAYAGNQRLRAAKKLAWKQIPCIVTPYDESRIKERIIRDNVCSGEWDWDILAADYEIDELLNLGLDESDIKEDKEKPKPPQLKAVIKFRDNDELERHQIFLENYTEEHNLELAIK